MPVGFAAAVALLWFVGPLVAVAGHAPLAGEPARMAVIALLALGLLALWAAKRWRAARRHRALLAGLVGGATTPAATAAPGSAEVALLSQRFEQAVATLRRTRLGRRRGWAGFAAPTVDQLPWYILVGAPGAGKTTALVNSGLEFPLAKALGAPVVQGIGGTRHCDWWFTSEAVLIDTAGRYTTHDSDRTADRAAWFGFLDLLLKHRPRQPINGVLLTLSVADLLGGSSAQRRAHAAALRDRIEELHAKLGIAFPVYVLVTKCDLLAGFMEFFADLDRDERSQVWGITFPYQAAGEGPGDGPAARLASDFAALEKRLGDCLIERLRDEPERARRAAIYTFPQQWHVLREALYEQLTVLLAELRAELRPQVRGVYFTSATQEGTPMDRALGGLTRALGLPARALLPSRPSGKTFFVTALLRQVVFAESGLAGTNLGWQRRRALLGAGLAGAAALGVAAAGALSWQAYADTRERLAALGQRLPALQAQVAAARAAPPTDLPALLPTLDALAAASQVGSDAQGPAGPLQRAARGVGLDRSEMLDQSAQDSYERALREGLLPRIALRLEQRLAAGDREHVELIYDTLKAYLMLFGGRSFDRDALRAYLLADWQATLPPGTSAAQQAALRTHLDRLLAGGEVGAPSQADPALIARSRALVAGVAPAQLAYQRIKQIEQAGDAPPFSAATFVAAPPGGGSARVLFARADNTAPDAGVPALFSRAAFEQVLPTRTREVLDQFARERSWVLGVATADTRAGDEALAAEVQRLYLAEYAQRWDQYLGGLRLAPAPTLAALAEQATQLARADSALPALLRAALRELSIAPLQGPGAGDAAARFDALRRYTAGPPGLEPLPGLFGALAAHLTAVDDAARRQAAPPAGDAIGALAAAATQAPEPLHAMLQQAAGGSATLAFGALREPLSRQLAAELAPACTRLLAQYPFARQASDELSREAFTRAFGSDGLFDAFFQRQLRAHVDTTGASWSFRADGSGADTLLPFQRAAAIREALFRDGGRTLGTRMEWRLLELEPGLAEFTLEVDGQLLRFKPGANTPQVLTWPGPGAGDASGGRVHLQLSNAAGPLGSGHTFQGPWALWRLLDRVRSEPGATPDRWRLAFDVEGRKARFEVRTGGAPNPIARQALEQFACPKKL